MSSLPELATLTPAAAGALLREIRGQRRPQLLDELQRLYHANEEDAVMSRAGILAGEIRLQRLDEYLMSLLPILGRESGPLGWDSFRPALRAFRRPGPGRVEAEVDLAFTPENHECVHGPLTLLPLGGLARRLLAAGERLTLVERVNWTVPLRHRLRLSLWDAGEHSETPEPDSVMSGRLRTSLGRTLDFAGVALSERPLLLQRDYNGLSHVLVAGTRLDFGPGRDGLTLELADTGLAACRRAVRQRPALAAAVVFDLVPVAILNWKPGRPMMCCGYSNVPLLASPAAAFASGTRLDLRYRADRSHLSARAGLWIAYYEFRYAPRQTDWSTIVMAEADDVATLLRKLHS